MPWGVRRIEDESTDPMYGGGRRTAMTVGEWLDSVSAPQRGRFHAGSRQTQSDQSPPAAIETLDRKLEELNRRLKRLADGSKTPSRDQRQDRDSTRRVNRMRGDRDWERDRDRDEDPVQARLDQIDRRLADLTRTPNANDYVPTVPASSAPSQSEVERLRQGLREIERLQAALVAGVTDQGRRSTADTGASTHYAAAQPYTSPVAETIARLEAEVRGLRQQVETRPARTEQGQTERLFDEIERLRDLIMEAGMRTANAVAPAKSLHEDRLADMVERLASVATSAQEKTSDDLKTLDRRMADVAARIGEFESRGASSKDINDLQRSINGISAKLDKPLLTQKPVIPAALIDLDIRIERLVERLDKLDVTPVNAKQLTSLENEISALRLDMAQTGGSSNTSRLENQIRQLGERIERLGTLAAGGGAKSAELEKFETRIGDLVDMLDRMVGSEVSLDQHVDALQGEVSALRRDIVKIADPARHGQLEEQIRLLVDRLQISNGQGQDPRVLAKIEEKISRIGDLFQADPGRSGDIRAIEAKLGVLEGLLNDRREDALQAASIAAREAVREFATFAADSRQSDQSVSALEDHLRDIQAATRTSELRTSDALQSVHEALTTIVSRLGAIERGVGEQGTPGPGYAGPLSVNRPAAPQVPLQSSAQSRTPAASPDRANDHSAMPQGDARSQPVQPRLPEPPANPIEDHRPLEPGSGKPQPSRASAMDPTTQRAAQPIAGPMPGNGPATDRSEGEAQAPKRNDFIAAARRAALAASQASTGTPPIPGDRARPDILSSIGSTDEAEPSRSTASRLKSLFKGKQKSLVIAGVGIAAAATAVSFVASNAMRVTSLDQMPTASIASSVPRAPHITPDATPAISDTSPAAIALAPPSSVTSTFSSTQFNEIPQGSLTADAIRQAALAAATKQQGQSPQNQAVPGQSGQVAIAKQQMPPPIGVAMADPQGTVDQTTTQSIAKSLPQKSAADGGLIPLPTEKIGSMALRSAAVNGDAKAQFEVAMRFSEGRGVTADMREAAVWFERAASRGFEPAAYRLGSAYEKGLGVDRNPTEAKRWYRQAAEGGNIRAMHNLGVLYANERDMLAALPWFQKAADSGLKDSQFNLGIIYALGSGVKQDLAVSYKWFSLGANQGDQEAAKKRDDIATHLERTLLASAKMAVSTWRGAPMSRDANEEIAVWSEPAAPATTASVPAVAAPNPNGWTPVMRAQAALQGKGFYTGKVDGELTPETKAAIKAFQKKAGLRQTGDVNEALLSAIVNKPM